MLMPGQQQNQGRMVIQAQQPRPQQSQIGNVNAAGSGGAKWHTPQQVNGKF